MKTVLLLSPVTRKWNLGYLEASEMAKKQCRMLEHQQVTMFHKKPLGKDKVRNGMKKITQWLKLTDWNNYRDQVLRAFIYTKLNNDNSMGIIEAMAAFT